MKKRSLSLFTIITLLVLSQPSFAAVESSSTAQWRPIAEITDFEKRIIAQASRQSSDWIYRDAMTFRVKHENVVEIMLHNGAIKYYAAGNSKNRMISQNQTELPDNEATQIKTALYHADEFYKIWIGRKGEELNFGELQEADGSMYAYLNILKAYPELSNYILVKSGITTLIIGNRGKRYLSAFQQLQLSSQDTIDFYRAFITSINHAKEDQPTDQEKMAAIEEIKNLLKQVVAKSIYFELPMLEEVKRLDPDFYESLINSNKEHKKLNLPQ